MNYSFPPDLAEDVRDCMASGLYSNEDDLLREAVRALKRQQIDVDAVREALSYMDAGERGRPFDEFVDEFRKVHQIPPHE